MIFSKLWKLKVCQVHQDLQDLRRGNCRVGGCRRHHRQVIRSHYYRHHRHHWRFHWCDVSRSCCKNIYPLLLLLLARYNIEFVKINNKKYARGWGIRSLSWFCLMYFCQKYFQTLSCCFLLQGWCHDGLSAHQKKCNTLSQIYPGDVLDTNAVIEFLTSEEALELPDKIEEVKSETFE